MTTNRPLRVFLCHSSADKPAVRELYQQLRAEPWINPWLDEEELFPGDDWNLEIQKAIRKTDTILVCISKSSITKEGYVQREISTALNYADEKPESAVYIIPIRLEECKPPLRLSKWHYADYFKDQREKAFEKLLVSLKKRFDLLGLKTQAVKHEISERTFPIPISDAIAVTPSSSESKSIDRETYEKVLDQARKQVKSLPKIVVYCLYKFFCDEIDVMFDSLDDRDKIRNANKAVEDYYLEVVDGRYSVNLYDPTILRVSGAVGKLEKCLRLIENDEDSNLYETLLSEYGFEPFVSSRRYWEYCLYEKPIN